MQQAVLLQLLKPTRSSPSTLPRRVGSAATSALVWAYGSCTQMPCDCTESAVLGGPCSSACWLKFGRRKRPPAVGCHRSVNAGLGHVSGASWRCSGMPRSRPSFIKARSWRTKPAVAFRAVVAALHLAFPLFDQLALCGARAARPWGSTRRFVGRHRSGPCSCAVPTDLSASLWPWNSLVSEIPALGAT